MNCAVCVHWSEHRNGPPIVDRSDFEWKSGDCRRRSPRRCERITTHREGVLVARDWPITTGNDWCGEYASDPRRLHLLTLPSSPEPRPQEPAPAAPLVGDSASHAASAATDAGSGTGAVTVDREELMSLALDCAFDGNGPVNSEAVDALVAHVQALVDAARASSACNLHRNVGY